MFNDLAVGAGLDDNAEPPAPIHRARRLLAIGVLPALLPFAAAQCAPSPVCTEYVYGSTYAAACAGLGSQSMRAVIQCADGHHYTGAWVADRELSVARGDCTNHGGVSHAYPQTG